MDKVIIAVACVAILVCAAVIVIDRIRVRRIYTSMRGMIDLAMKDELTETILDESCLSALESKLYDFLTASEVSARYVAEEKNTIKTLIADISHQTKTPIANLLLYCELLGEQPLGEEAAGYVGALHSQTDKLKFLIDSLVKLSRLENGVLALSPVMGGVGPMLHDIAEQYAPKAAEKGLTLTVGDGCDDPEAVFDRKWTEEAIGNIVDNAIKYTAEGGVRISVSATELFQRIDISDTGIGISEEEQAKVFARFYRSQEVSDRQGVGIGLYLAREIIMAEGGYIRLTSEHGRGSVFSVYLSREGEKHL